MKIYSGNKMALIIHRRSAEAALYENLIQHESATGEQPFYGINFLDGVAVGGRTMSNGQRELMMQRAREAGLRIEE